MLIFSILLAVLAIWSYALGPIYMFLFDKDNEPLSLLISQLICFVSLVAYIISQRYFKGAFELIFSIPAISSIIFVGYKVFRFILDHSLSQINTLALSLLISELVLPSIVTITVITIIISFISLLFWGPIVDLLDIIRVDRYKRFKMSDNNGHVIITGGGTGLGKATAILFSQMGVRYITIVSRSMEHLEETKQLCASIAKYKMQKVFTIACDVTNFIALESALHKHIAVTKAPDLVICSAGVSIPGYFLSTDIKIYESQMKLNYLGSVNTARALAPLMVNREKPSELGHSWVSNSSQFKGEICFVSSALGLFGCVGYSMYSPTKFAVRGLAESLRYELEPKGVSISCFYPSNMQTESFFEELKTKPIEAKRIDESANTITASEGANKLIVGIGRGQFHITTEWLLDALRVGVLGLTPSPSPVIEFLMTPAIYLCGKVFRLWSDYICRSEERKRHDKKSQ